MLISAKSEYAIRAMVELAGANGEGRTCDQIAIAQSLPKAFLGRILNDLRRSGLLRSQRGSPGGGWRLAVPATSITLADVVTAIDGPLEARDPPIAPRSLGGAALLDEVWQSVGQAIGTVLQGVTIAALAQPAVVPSGQR